MPAQNIIELGFNIEELTSEKKQVLDLMVDLFGQLKQYDGTKFNPLGTEGLAGLKKSMTDSSAAMDGVIAKANEVNKVYADQAVKQQAAKKSTDETTLAVQQYSKIVDQAAQVQAKANALTSTAAENLAIDKEQLKLRNAELQKSASFLTAESNSVGEAKAANALLTIERDKQNTTTEEGKAKIAELNAAMDKNNEIIRANSSLLEKQKINIGNYNGAVTVLESGLAGISEKLNQFAAAGDSTSEAVQKLTLEQQILKVLLEKQSAGFSSVTQEVRATKNALDTLAVAGLENSETFQKLNVTYEESKSKLNELHNQQKILTDANPALAALTATARGLGGAYALGAGASALFADGNEKVEKELNKLVAIMTFLQGLEEAVRAVRERGAIATALQAAGAKALNAVRQIELAIFGQTVAATEADTVAKTVNTEAMVVNAEAVEANAVGVEVNTVAMEGTTVATEAASVATLSLRATLIATGIGAIIIGVIYAITKLVGAINDWANADEKAEEKNKALAESSKELLDISEKLNDAFEEGSKKKVDALEKENDKVKAAGQNQFIQLANERKIAQQRQQNAKETLAFMDLEGGALDAVGERRADALLKVEGIESEIRSARLADDKKEVERLQKKKEAANAEFQLLDTQYTKGLAATKEYNDQTAKIEENSIQQAKAAADLLAKITADAAQRRFESIKDANDRILSLDSSTEPQRLAAIKSNYNAEVALSGAQVEAIKKLETDKILTEKDAADQIANIQSSLNIKYKASLEEQRKIREDYADRNATAKNAISKNNNESDASIQEAISKDVQKELDDRLIALKRNIDDKTKIIIDDYNLQLTLAREHGKTEAEIQQLASDRDKALVELTANTQKEIYDITLSYGDRKLKAIEDQNKAIDSANQVTTDYNAQTDSLNTALINQTISYRKYVDSKRLLDRQYNIDHDNAEIADDEKRLAQIRDFELKQLNIKVFFAEKALDAAKLGGDQNEIDKAQAKVDALHVIQVKAAGDEVQLNNKLNDDKRKKNADTVKANEDAEKLADDRKKELEVASFNLGVELVDASYENKINAIQKEIDAVDSQAAAETEAVQRSTLSQRDQAAELIIIQADQRAKDTQLKQQQKQEKIKEAHFDQDVALAKIGWSTAQAVMKDTADVPWPLSLEIAVLDIALGAVQAAAVLAKPVPTYGDGVIDHPGGAAWVGELYKPELISIPGMDPFVVDRPTLIDLPARSSVLPMSDSDMIADLGGSAMRRGTQWVNSWPDNNQWEIVQALDRQTGRLVRAYKQSQKRIMNVINVNIDPGWEDYKRKKITGR